MRVCVRACVCVCACVCACVCVCTCFSYFVGPGDREHTNGVGPNSLAGPKIVGPTPI